MPGPVGVASLVLAALLCGVQTAAWSQPLAAAPPSDAGFAPGRLERLHARVQRFVDEGRHAGIITLIARHGKVVDVRTHGLRDLERQLPMERDTIVRIYSMTKVITSVAVMMLVEEGRPRLDDPVSTYLPELASQRVFTGGTAAAPVVADVTGPITIRHLLTHTSGFVYGFGRGELDKIYQEGGVLATPTMDAFVAKAARLPLASEPGERFGYGISTDLLGAVVEKVAAQPFDAFVRARITEPLGMRDTGFTVSEDKRARLAKVYTTGKDGLLAPVPVKGVPYPDEQGRGFASGGGGLFSTIDDYARFGQTMRTNHLTLLERQTTDSSRSDGFGLGGAVRLDLASGSPLGSVGQFGWSGAATTYFNIDPAEGVLALVFAQHMPFNEHDLFGVFTTMMYAALVDPAPRGQ